jgi:ribonuclease PH
LPDLGERQVKIDCDVIEADGGTRVASICGAYVAMAHCLKKAVVKGTLKTYPVHDSVAAISCGLVQGQVLLDLDYAEDSSAETDANFVFAGSGALVEVHAMGEKATFSKENFTEMMILAESATQAIKKLQDKALEET